MINTINDLLNRLVDTIEEGLKSADPGSALGFSAKAAAEGRIIDTDEEGKEILGDEVRREIEEGVHKLETLLESTVDKNFDKWEIYVLRNCLTLGREAEELMGWIRLKGYEVCDNTQGEALRQWTTSSQIGFSSAGPTT